MPKDRAENQGLYKIQGGTLNEYEFTRNQEALSQEERERAERLQPNNLLPGTPPQVEAERIAELTAEVHELVQRRKAKGSVKQENSAATTRRLSAGKASKKATAAKKTAAKKGATKANTVTAERAGKSGGRAVSKATAKKAEKGSASRTTGRAKAAVKRASAKKSASTRTAKTTGARKSATKAGSRTGTSRKATGKSARR
jgi:hypothetical protein